MIWKWYLWIFESHQNPFLWLFPDFWREFQLFSKIKSILELCVLGNKRLVYFKSGADILICCYFVETTWSVGKNIRNTKNSEQISQSFENKPDNQILNAKTPKWATLAHHNLGAGIPSCSKYATPDNQIFGEGNLIYWKREMPNNQILVGRKFNLSEFWQIMQYLAQIIWSASNKTFQIIQYLLRIIRSIGLIKTSR